MLCHDALHPLYPWSHWWRRPLYGLARCQCLPPIVDAAVVIQVVVVAHCLSPLWTHPTSTSHRSCCHCQQQRQLCNGGCLWMANDAKAPLPMPRPPPLPLVWTKPLIAMVTGFFGPGRLNVGLCCTIGRKSKTNISLNLYINRTLGQQNNIHPVSVWLRAAQV